MTSESEGLSEEHHALVARIVPGRGKYMGQCWAFTDEELTALLDAARSSGQQAPEGWRPLDTCPSDGTDVLLAWSNGDVERREADGQWWRSTSTWGPRRPVAWMPNPLPAPPEGGL